MHSAIPGTSLAWWRGGEEAPRQLLPAGLGLNRAGYPPKQHMYTYLHGLQQLSFRADFQRAETRPGQGWVKAPGEASRSHRGRGARVALGGTLQPPSLSDVCPLLDVISKQQDLTPRRSSLLSKVSHWKMCRLMVCPCQLQACPWGRCWRAGIASPVNVRHLGTAKSLHINDNLCNCPKPKDPRIC